MAFRKVDETVESLLNVNDDHRLSLYAKLHSNDLQELNHFCDNHLKKQATPRKEKLRISLEDLFSKPKLHYKGDETDQEKGSSTQSLHIGSRTESNLVVRDQIGIEYTIQGIRIHEFPVKGFYMDDRICPGFKYTVRYLGSDKEVFEGVPRVLQTIGMGYGKRLTFKGDKPNNNDCFFWTDNCPEGYGFSINVINKGDSFVIYDEMNSSIGDVIIESVEGPQIEESMKCNKGDITKKVRVRFTCSIRYHNRIDHNLYDLAHQDLQTIEGVAEVVKSKKSKEASVVCIRDVRLKCGKCTLWNELV